MRVVIRADASTATGIGHLMRCLALAQALRDAGDQVTLVSRLPAADAMLDAWMREGVEIHWLEAHAGSDDDAHATRGIVRSAAASWLVVDGYDFDTDYRSAAQGSARLAWIDDLGAQSVSADLIVNGNVYARDELYPGTSARLAIGPRHALLRREFRVLRAKRDRRDGVLVSLGGADPGRRTGPLLGALTARGIRGRVIVGPHQGGAEEVLTRAARLGWEAIQAPDEMSSLLASCSLAVVGAGTTTLETLALGTPMIAVRIAENQQAVAETLDRLGLAVVTEGSDPVSTADEAAALLADDERLRAMAMRGRGTVDGRGALRVAGEMRGALLGLRPATLGDAPLMLAWRNDPETRRSSFQTREIRHGEHWRWVSASLESRSRHLLVGEVESVPIGLVRLDLEGSDAIISITVAPEARGRGLAVPLLRRALDRATELGVSRVEARIRRENEASRRAFAAAGFEELGEPPIDPGMVRMFASPPGRG